MAAQPDDVAFFELMGKEFSPVRAATLGAHFNEANQQEPIPTPVPDSDEYLKPGYKLDKLGLIEPRRHVVVEHFLRNMQSAAGASPEMVMLLKRQTLERLHLLLDMQSGGFMSIIDMASYIIQRSASDSRKDMFERPPAGTELFGTFSRLLIAPWYDIKPETNLFAIKEHEKKHGLHVVLNSPFVVNKAGVVVSELDEPVLVPLQHGEPELYYARKTG